MLSGKALQLQNMHLDVRSITAGADIQRMESISIVSANVFLLMVYAGTVIAQVGQEQLELLPGMAVIIDSHVKWRMLSTPSCLEAILVEADYVRRGRELCLWRQLSDYGFIAAWQREVAGYCIFHDRNYTLYQMAKRLLTLPPGDLLDTTRKYFLLCATVYAADYHLRMNRGGGGAGNTASVRTALRYIHTHYFDPILVADIARESGIHACYLGRIFKQEMRLGIKQYIEQYRMQKALIMLRYTQLQAGEIARKVGIRSDHYFSRLFKKSFGQTPIEYRKSLEVRAMLPGREKP